MTLYQQFFNYLEVPTEEEFNELLKDIPPMKELSDEFLYEDLGWDQDYNYLKNALVFDSIRQLLDGLCVVDDVNLEYKEVSVVDIDSIEDLDRIESILTDNGFTLYNYEGWKEEILKDKEEEKLIAKRQNIRVGIEKFNEEQLNKLEKLIKRIMKRESYVKRLATSYKNLSDSEKKMFLEETELLVMPKETPNA